MKRISLAVLFAGCAAVALVHGYTLAPDAVRWIAGPVTFHSHVHTAAAQRAVMDALRVWQPPLQGEIRLEAVGSRGDLVIGNQANDIGWETLPREVVSLTRLVSREGYLVEADISIAPDAAAPTAWSVDRILLHEVGHALGLEHADAGGQNVGAVLSADPGATAATLTRDDEAGLIEAYRPLDLTARVRDGLTPQDVAFPPRNEPFAFRQQLETVYQNELGRSATPSFVDLEGSVIWTQEYIRYRVNGCDNATATARVIAQIEGRGIQPICVDFTGTTVLFPPRQEPLQFRLQLETVYRDTLRRATTPTFVDAEGDVIWTQEYLRYRVNGCSNQQATDRVLAQVRGGPVQPVCATPTPTPPPTPAPTATLRGIVSDEATLMPIANATITVAALGFGGGSSRSTTTGSDGLFTLTGLTPGQVVVTAARSGYRTTTRDVTLAAGDTSISFLLVRDATPSLSGYEVVQGTNATTGAPGTTGEVTVTCPGTKRVLAGGHLSVAGVEVWRVFRSYPTISGNGWVVTYVSVTAGQLVRAVAVCATVPTELAYEVVNGANATMGAPGSSGEVTAACPGNKRALGGGYLSVSGVEVWRVFRSYLQSGGAGWVGTYRSGEAGQSVRAAAICASVPTELGYEVVRSASTTTGPPADVGELTVSCPAGKRALGGGFESDDGVEVWRVFRNHPSSGGFGWTTTFSSVTAGRTVRPTVVCGSVP